MKTQTISVVIPTYNRLAQLKELLISLSVQTLLPDEVIIVNDAGAPVELITECFPQLSIKIFNQPVNQLHVEARKRGVKEATGELIMLIDDDDWIVSSHIERMAAAIKDYDLVYSDVEIVEYHNESGLRVPVNRFLFAYELNLQEMRKFSTFVPSGTLYRKAIHDSIGEFDAEMKNYWDWDFFLRVSEVFRIQRVPVAGVIYDFTPGHDNQSANLEGMRHFLDKLSAKHNLGTLPVKNFKLLLKEPEIIARQAETLQVWDGQMPYVDKLIK
ncbi:glycosyltransferase family 2 protein [Jeotgalibacillus aurantiacus]|uniref:glycosyltransferase family 2 protein n=1 Tax=Jeotgalibacillus aurantiacus TaxID=2763266 RepID=UPI001D0AACF7|nr:glycosyltransferase family 2 protein [Jeotgalibacillus aurantiacus]